MAHHHLPSWRTEQKRILLFSWTCSNEINCQTVVWIKTKRLIYSDFQEAVILIKRILSEWPLAASYLQSVGPTHLALLWNQGASTAWIKRGLSEEKTLKSHLGQG